MEATAVAGTKQLTTLKPNPDNKDGAEFVAIKVVHQVVGLECQSDPALWVNMFRELALSQFAQ